ncbi:MAG: TonB-dependent receptor [Prevotella sp.]|jgi:TonB-linked SusC/RagA family outer membrane protein|nr:TonB-dependent receptor [Prevotella sp.]MCH4018748.1 TonB-dependent receptor [Prevotella sp.]MCI1291802.1 TonB-dependent receptor [Prevotella sp.]MCI1325269.1 TonB-dependent receptor [Prevotella sp.]MCI1350163.1 TonB-dependent receptor [Prevotella sp.]MCI1371793.1 TonB-dependent receptor [Prevotella sp.]
MKQSRNKITLLAGFCSLALLSFSPAVYAAGEGSFPSIVQQNKKVTGVISDEQGPIIGATVRIKGGSTGTVTDIDGHYSLEVSPGETLEISYVGYVTRLIKVNNQSVVNVTLKEDHQNLNEVVVVGYGSMKKSDISGASSTLNDDAIKNSIISSVDQSLQGRVAGITAMQTSGAPGSSTSVRVRGTATLNSNAEPLYVIDGVIFQSNGSTGSSLGFGDALGNGQISTISPLSTLNPDDIQSIEILKDASATAIYGAQGANGVILITTKRGKAGKSKFTYDGSVAWSRQARRLDIMNLRDYAGFYNDFVKTGQADPNDYYSDPSLLGRGTNWQDAIFQTAFQDQHQLSAEGGNDQVKYFVSGGYLNQEGTIIGSNFDRLSFRSNLDAKLKSWLRMGFNASFANTHDKLLQADGDEGVVNYSLTTLPDIPIYNIDGGYSSIVREGFTNPNPIALALMDDIRLHRQKLSGSLFFDITPIKHLVYHAEFGWDLNWSQGDTYMPTVDLGTWKRSKNESRIQKNTGTYWTIKNYVTYSNTLGLHSFSAMVGQEAWKSHWDYISTDNTGLPSDAVHNPSLGTGTPQITNGWGTTTMASFFGRLTYNYADRYMATATLRFDGSSNFGPNKRWASFPSFAVGWRFTNEKFVQSWTRNWLNNGKLRIGWGATGNAGDKAYRWGTTITRMPSFLGMGYRPSNIPNPDVKWESQKQWNVGLDLGFFNDRIGITADWYRKESKDLLMLSQLPSFMGTSGNVSSALTAPYGNYGDLLNTGLELTLNTHPVVGRFQWDSNFEISWNKSTLQSLQGATSTNLVGYGQWNDVVSVTRVGGQLFDFYGYVTDGIYQNLKDLQTSAKPEKYPADGKFNRNNTVYVGDIKYKDLNGDGVIDAKDQTDLGHALPKFTWGWTNTFRYQNFDLTVFINGSVGAKALNYMKMKLTEMNTTWSNQLKDVLNRAILEPIDPTVVYTDGSHWYDHVENVKVANPGATMPRATLSDPNNNDRISDRYIENASYLRMKNIALGYTFPKKWIDHFGVSNLRVYFNIQNLFTITPYDGYDPEIGRSTNDSNGFSYNVDAGRYPSPITFSFGLNLTF